MSEPRPSWPSQRVKAVAIEFLQASDKARLSRDALWLAGLCQALGQSGRGGANELRARIDMQAMKFLSEEDGNAASRQSPHFEEPAPMLPKYEVTVLWTRTFLISIEDLKSEDIDIESVDLVEPETAPEVAP